MAKVKHVRRWLERRHPLVGFFALSVVAGADALRETCEAARGAGPDCLRFPRPDARTWCGFYRRHRQINAAAFEGAFGSHAARDTVFHWVTMAQELGASREQPQEKWAAEIRDVVEAHGGLAEVGREGLAEYETLLNALVEDLESPEKNQDAVAKLSPEMFFYLCIQMPCWLHFGQSHTRLLRKARQGDIEAIENLLRLDKRILEDTRIRQHIYDSFHQTSNYACGRIGMALKKDCLRHIPEQKFKILLGALVRKISMDLDNKVQACWEGLTGCPAGNSPGLALTAPDVRRLFDAWTRDTRGILRAPDLPSGDDTFSKALRRDFDFWGDLPGNVSHTSPRRREMAA